MVECLTQADVTRLLQDRSADARIDALTKLGAHIQDETLAPAERRIALEIVRVMVQDVEVRVREALAQMLKESALVPHDVAVTLANDVEAVSLPMLEASPVFTDEDLIEIARSQDVARQMAVARRNSISCQLADALIDTGEEEVIGNLVANDGADISSSSMHRVLDEHGHSIRIKSALVHRHELPMAISERLVTMVSERLRAHLLVKHELSPDIVETIILDTRERATIGLLSDAGNSDVIERLVSQLQVHSRLTPSLVFRALCVGKFAFFEASLAHLGDLSAATVKAMIRSSGPAGVKYLLMRLDIPSKWRSALSSAAEIVYSESWQINNDHVKLFSRRMIDRLRSQRGRINPEDLEFVLDKLSAFSSPDAPSPVAH